MDILEDERRDCWVIIYRAPAGLVSRYPWWRHRDVNSQPCSRAAWHTHNCLALASSPMSDVKVKFPLCLSFNLVLIEFLYELSVSNDPSSDLSTVQKYFIHCLLKRELPKLRLSTCKVDYLNSWAIYFRCFRCTVNLITKCRNYCYYCELCIIYIEG